jgi:hypothetical protein
MHATNDIPLERPLSVPVHTVNRIQTLKVAGELLPTVTKATKPASLTMDSATVLMTSPNTEGLGS